MPVQLGEYQLSSFAPAEEIADIVAGYESRDYRKGSVDPCAGDGGDFVKPENECHCNGKGSVQPEKRGEADEYTNSKTGCDMAGMTVQRHDRFKFLFQFVFIDHKYQFYGVGVRFVNGLRFTVPVYSASIKKLSWIL